MSAESGHKAGKKKRGLAVRSTLPRARYGIRAPHSRSVRMIRLDNIGKQNGHQILFVQARGAQKERWARRSQRGRQNDAVRMIMGQKHPTRPSGRRRGYHRLLQPGCGRDVGRSAMSEMMTGRPGEHRGYRVEGGAGGRHGIGPDGRHGEHRRALRRGAGGFEELDGYALRVGRAGHLAGLGFSRR